MVKKLFFLVLMLLILMPTSEGYATIQDSYIFKLTIIKDGIETEWEFINPNEFEVEQGNRVIKGKAAKQEVIKMYKLLNVSESIKVEEMVVKLKNNGYRDISRVDVRWKNNNEKLFTWVWEKQE